ncbi:VOC family protein [Streptomyces nondiastaticus]|uniref:VOC family protein n=1 Tax=Streptomyces nondiastaticus TaxID=3154512 RepID=A0ABW6U4W8_9ACTN
MTARRPAPRTHARKRSLSFHMDFSFPRVDVAEKRLLRMGATKPAHQPGGKHWTVLLDPSGQPFCIHGTY